MKDPDYEPILPQITPLPKWIRPIWMVFRWFVWGVAGYMTSALFITKTATHTLLNFALYALVWWCAIAMTYIEWKR